MTRGQVAKRLGKSLASVRRIEGVLLYSVRDTQGVHQFDADEVESLARKLERGETTLWQALRHAKHDAAVSGYPLQNSELETELESLREELAQEKRRHQRELEALHAEHERERAERERERRQFERELAEFVRTLAQLAD